MVERTNYGDADVESQSLWIALSVRSFQLHKQLPGDGGLVSLSSKSQAELYGNAWQLAATMPL